MLKFKRFIIEGGNIKVGAKGSEVSAEPFSVTAKNRSERRADIHHALGSIHDAFHAEHGEHLFGENQHLLHSGNAYTGSTNDLMGRHVGDKEFAHHKPVVGDIDTQVSKDHKDKLASTLKPGRKFGKYTVVGTKKHGNEISAVMRHENGEHHQFDFQGVHHPGSESERFLHSSHWEDTKKGIKGAHHKILINAVGGDSHKFSITHGLRSRTDESDPGVSHPAEVTHALFGHGSDHSKIHSFQGVTDLIKKHKSKEEQHAIYNKFKDSVSKMRNLDSGPALAHMRKHLGIKESVNESVRKWSSEVRAKHGSDVTIKSDKIHNRISAEKDGKVVGSYQRKTQKGTVFSEDLSEEAEQHAHMTFMGASPITHMGHHIDVVGSMEHGKPGKKFVGLSGKSDVFSDSEREHISNKQSGGKAEFKVEKSAGQTVARAFNSMKGSGPKHLHLHFGHDRKDFAERLKSSIEAGKIPELEGHKPDHIHIHYPKDEDRSHGMSGTKMRTAAASGDHETFKKHLGPNFSDKEAKSIMDRTRVGLMAGKIKVKR